MMLTFRSYLSDRKSLMSVGKLANELARKTNDPEKFVLDFVEVRYPDLYEPLLESIYLENDPRVPTGDGSQNSTAPTGGDDERPGARPANKVQHGTFLGWLSDLFSGGGAAKNFDKAVKAITKVDSVVKTIHIPDEYQQEGGDAAGYDNFRNELHAVLEKMKELGQQSQLLHVADAIKRDPNYVQELEGKLTDSGVYSPDGEEDNGEEAPAPPPSKIAVGDDTTREVQNHPLAKTVIGEVQKLAAPDATLAPKVGGATKVNGYLEALAKAVIDMFAAEQPSKQNDTYAFMNWFGAADKAKVLKDAAARVQEPAPVKTPTPVDGSEHGGGSTPVDGYHPSHTVHRGDVFAEALILAGIPQPKKRKTR